MLDAPYPLEPNAPLTVTVLSEDDQEREDWARFGRQNLARAYGDDEPEYTLADIKELNPDYKGPKLENNFSCVEEPCHEWHGYTAQTPQNAASRG